MNNLYKILFWLGIAATSANLGLYIETPKYLAMAVYAVLFGIAMLKSWKKRKPLIFICWLLLVALGFFVCISSYDNSPAHAIELAMPLMICYSAAYLFDTNESDFEKWFLPVSAFICYCAIMSVVKSVGVLMMADNLLEETSKNQICPFFTIIAIVSFALSMKNGINIVNRLYFIFVSIICNLPSLYLLNRTSLLGFALVAFLIVYSKAKVKGLIILSLLLFVIIFVAGSSLTDVLYESVVGERDTSDIDSLSSNRSSLISIAVDFIFENPLIGGMGVPASNLPSNVHVYVLYNIVRYGLIGSLPFLILYCTIIQVFLKAYKKKHILCTGVLMLALLESLAEYASPFGPGTTYVFCYTIVGIFIREYYHLNTVTWKKRK